MRIVADVTYVGGPTRLHIHQCDDGTEREHAQELVDHILETIALAWREGKNGYFNLGSQLFNISQIAHLQLTVRE